MVPELPRRLLRLSRKSLKTTCPPIVSLWDMWLSFFLGRKVCAPRDLVVCRRMVKALIYQAERRVESKRPNKRRRNETQEQGRMHLPVMFVELVSKRRHQRHSLRNLKLPKRHATRLCHQGAAFLFRESLHLSLSCTWIINDLINSNLFWIDGCGKTMHFDCRATHCLNAKAWLWQLCDILNTGNCMAFIWICDNVVLLQQKDRTCHCLHDAICNACSVDKTWIHWNFLSMWNRATVYASQGHFFLVKTALTSIIWTQKAKLRLSFFQQSWMFAAEPVGSWLARAWPQSPRSLRIEKVDANCWWVSFHINLVDSSSSSQLNREEVDRVCRKIEYFVQQS